MGEAGMVRVREDLILKSLDQILLPNQVLDVMELVEQRLEEQLLEV
jgi:hypothetical protein